MSGKEPEIPGSGPIMGYARLKPPGAHLKTNTNESTSAVAETVGTISSSGPTHSRRIPSPSRVVDRPAQRNASIDVSIRQIKETKSDSEIDRRILKNKEILGRDKWLLKRGHTLTYIGIFLFTLTLYFRPYELIPALSGLNFLALLLAIATLLIYIPTQFATEGNITAMTTEVKCVLFLAAWSVASIPVAKDPGLAWETFVGLFSKVALMFIIMVNTLRSRARIQGLIWLGIGVGLMLTYQALDMYLKGQFKTEGYRVSVDFGGMFGNPNDLAIHLALFIPLAIVLGLSSRNALSKAVYFGSSVVMAVGVMITQSRGGFLGLIAAALVLTWKLGRRRRTIAVIVVLLFGASFMAFAPGNYGIRMMSIVDSDLDPVGSSDQRTELLKRSILVTLRNPQGIGMGNFPVVGQHNLQSHNAYTQVSSELGWLCFAAYLILLISPFRKLGMIERELNQENDHSWLYYTAIGVQATLAAYLVSSFFGSVAYQWYVYYPIAFAVCLRRLHAERIGGMVLHVSKTMV
ncbi:MAG: O-antigen ligase family protein [Pyrinomonadaceae bacterium]